MRADALLGDDAELSPPAETVVPGRMGACMCVLICLGAILDDVDEGLEGSRAPAPDGGVGTPIE